MRCYMKLRPPCWRRADLTRTASMSGFITQGCCRIKHKFLALQRLANHGAARRQAARERIERKSAKVLSGEYAADRTVASCDRGPWARIPFAFLAFFCGAPTATFLAAHGGWTWASAFGLRQSSGALDGGHGRRKAAEDCRTPRRYARFGHLGGWSRGKATEDGRDRARPSKMRRMAGLPPAPAPRRGAIRQPGVKPLAYRIFLYRAPCRGATCNACV